MDLGYKITFKGPILDGKGPELAHEQVTAFLYEVTAFLEAKVKEDTPQGVGGRSHGLWATIHGEVEEKGVEVQKGVVAHTSVYGDPVERGRRPGRMPGYKTLIPWVELKFGVSGQDAERIAFFVTRKIAQKGTKGAAMFFRGLDENWPEVVRIAERHGVMLTDKLRGQ